MTNKYNEEEHIQSPELRIAVTRIEGRLDAIEDRIEHLITKWEFAPVRLLVYGIAGTLLTTIILSLVKLILK